MELQFLSLFLMAAFYIIAGLSHFRLPKFFVKITPVWVPAPKKVNILIGIVEMLLGFLLLVPATTALAAWGIVVLLILVFPANIRHHQLVLKKGKNPWPTLLRLPLQLLLIWWAYSFTSM